jgi:hypothetical protein
MLRSVPGMTVRRNPAAAVRILQMVVGPLTLLAFFLPWTHGVGPLASTQFTGFRLVGFAGRLQALDLTPAQGGLLLLVRVAILGVALSGAWMTLLGPRYPYHLAYRLSGWYAAAFAAAALVLGAAKAGPTTPPVGLALLAASAALFAALEFRAPHAVRGR